MTNSGFRKYAPPKNLSQEAKPNLEFQYLQKDNKKHPVLVVLLFIIFIIILIIAGNFGYQYFKKQQNKKSSQEFNVQDFDGDSLSTTKELELGTDPENNDTDFDQMPDGWEIKNRLDPKDYLDATKDNDEDMLTNLQEFQYNSDPNKKDTDNDSFDDYQEVINGFNPNGEGKIIK